MKPLKQQLHKYAFDSDLENNERSLMYYEDDILKAVREWLEQKDPLTRSAQDFKKQLLEELK